MLANSADSQTISVAPRTAVLTKSDLGATFTDEVTFVVATGTEPAWVLDRSFAVDWLDNIAVDKDGNIFLGRKGRVDKFSPSGELLWSVDPWPGCYFQSNASDIGVDSKGNVYVAFTYYGGTPPTGILHRGGRDVLLAKISPDGIPGRPKRIATSADDYVYEMVIDDDDFIYLSGWTGGTLMDPVYLSIAWNTWVAKYDSDFQDDAPGYNDNSDLEPVWGSQITHKAYYQPSMVDLSVSPTGDVYVAGEIYSDLNYEGPYYGSSDYYISRWTNSGQ
ncbi:MAG: hypothetical protein L3J79_11815 [Candidatus Marinimicrobia bacterium]|nr:hypothetical protein [Candidatus Neomarinimicrobiota bacterium]